MTGSDQHRMGVEADAVLRLGMLYMGAGTGGYRVIRGMKRAGRALGFDRLDANIAVTTITCTFHKGAEFRTVVASQDSPGVDASRIEALETLTHTIRHRITAEWLNARLDEIETGVVKRWSLPLLVVAAGLACASFAVLNHFSLVDALVVAVSAAAGQFVRGSLARKKARQLASVSAGAVTACLTFWVVIQLLGLAGVVSAQAAAPGFVASVLFVVPGFPLFSAMIDLSRFDFAAGISRLFYAVTLIAAATLSVALVSWVTGLEPPTHVPQVGDPRFFIRAGFASFIGISGFALLFNSSRRMVLIAATTGTVGNLARLALIYAGATAYAGAFVGGLTIGLLGWVAAKKARIPRTTTTIPAAVIMIPGPSMFASIYALNVGDMQLGVTAAATAVLTVLSIGTGMVVARMLTDRAWLYGQHIDLDAPLPPSAS
ncbi:threonine/serine exporter family protein [Corynebacterium pyruviciproducens]|uniref:threonine/serine ThrE exporter family protein n=1 Tax=Corynebacterium pyruviciproducens TaxID=598660 RepID=UPI0023F0B183|nr:threonine/serine exporter family protein [Corynebacterium pyruviciproducens]MDK7214235.1 threonine/serine exporter family protein [Corynebacterium pyruviciproducens]